MAALTPAKAKTSGPPQKDLRVHVDPTDAQVDIATGTVLDADGTTVVQWSPTGAPLLLTNPVTGALATALAALTPPATKGIAYRALDAGAVTVTGGGRTATWAHLAGEGYDIPVIDIIAAASRVLVFV